MRRIFLILFALAILVPVAQALRGESAKVVVCEDDHA